MKHPWSGLGSLPKELWILFFTTLVNRAGMMALPFLVLYLTQDLKFSSDDAALGLVVYGVGALITAPIAGRLTDHFGPRTIMLTSLFSSGAALLCMPWFKNFPMVITGIIVWSILSEAFRPASMTLVGDVVTAEQRKPAFALFRLAINIGMSIGPAVGGFLATVSYPAIFWVDGGTALLAGLVLALSPWRARHLQTEHHSETRSNTKGAFDWRMIYFLVALLPVQAVFFQHESAMPVFLVKEVHLSEAIYGMLFTVNTGLIILLEVSLNLWMSKWSHHRSLALGCALVGLGFGATIWISDAWTAALTVIVWTFGEMILFPASNAYMSEIAPPARRGFYMGFYQMTFSLAFIIGPWLGLQVLEHFGAEVLWPATLVAGFLSALLMIRIRSNTELSPDVLKG